MKIDDPELVEEMLATIAALQRQNDAVGCTRIRHRISEYVVRIRLLVRDGNERALNGGSARA